MCIYIYIYIYIYIHILSECLFGHGSGLCLLKWMAWNAEQAVLIISEVCRQDGLIDQFIDVGIFYQCRRVLKCKDSIHHCDFLAGSMTNSEWCIRLSRTTATASPNSSKIRLILWSEFQAHRMSFYMAFILVAFYKSNASPCFMW